MYIYICIYTYEYLCIYMYSSMYECVYFTYRSTHIHIHIYIQYMHTLRKSLALLCSRSISKAAGILKRQLATQFAV